jgi:hypothetical protein
MGRDVDPLASGDDREVKNIRQANTRSTISTIIVYLF